MKLKFYISAKIDLKMVLDSSIYSNLVTVYKSFSAATSRNVKQCAYKLIQLLEILKYNAISKEVKIIKSMVLAIFDC